MHKLTEAIQVQVQVQQTFIPLCANCVAVSTVTPSDVLWSSCKLRSPGGRRVTAETV